MESEVFTQGKIRRERIQAEGVEPQYTVAVLSWLSLEAVPCEQATHRNLDSSY